MFALNVLFALAWDLHTIFVPVYGASVGLSASQVGMVLSSFALATFTVRLAMPLLARRFDEFEVLTAALVVAAAAYCGFPFTSGAATMMALSFALGLGLGSGQPMVMSLLYTHSPPGRMGEAAGVRMSVVQSMAVAVPLVFGALGATVGLAPVFWSVGACLAAGSWLAGRRRADAPRRRPAAGATPPALAVRSIGRPRSAASAAGLLQPVDEVLAELGDLGRDDQRAVGLAAVAREVLLVVGLGRPEPRGGRDLGDDRVREEPARVELARSPPPRSPAARRSGRRSPTGTAGRRRCPAGRASWGRGW